MRRLGVVAEIAGHGGTDGECERGVRLGGADEHVVEHSPVREQFLSERIASGPEPGRPADRGYRNGSHRDLDREIHIATDLVGDTGIEPVTSSV